MPNRQNEPAFPVEESHGDGVQQITRHLGLTVREYTVIAMAQGIVMSPTSDEMSFEEIATRAWKQADALLAAPDQTGTYPKGPVGGAE